MMNTSRIILILILLSSHTLYSDETNALPHPTLPFAIHGDCDATQATGYEPSGWIGNRDDIAMDECWKTMPHSGIACLKLTYSGKGDWGGIAWQHPPNDWGNKEGGFDLTGAKHLVVWARGHKGGELVKFEMGLIKGGVRYPDSCYASLGPIPLSKRWKKYKISLKRLDLSRVKTAFSWTVEGINKPVIFYLDDITYE